MTDESGVLFQDLLNSAVRAKRRKEYAAARDLALQALELKPQHWEALRHLEEAEEGITSLRFVVRDERPIEREPSELEKEMLGLLTRAGFQLPRVEYPPPPFSRYRIDFAFRELRLAIETDGRQFHGAARREYDRNRDSNLQRIGWRTVRLSWNQVTSHPYTVIRGLLVEALRRLHLPDSEIRSRVPKVLDGTAPPPSELVADVAKFRKYVVAHHERHLPWSIDDPFGADFLASVPPD